MSKVKIYIEIDGTPVPIDECTWVKVAPCGCECGWSLAEYSPTYDEAWKSLGGSKQERERDEKLGFTLKIGRHTDIRIKDGCTHTPRWGVDPIPTPEGHSWAASYQSRRLHLVPLVIEEDGLVINTAAPPVKTLCGRASGTAWSRRGYDIEGLVECTACERAAKAVTR